MLYKQIADVTPASACWEVTMFIADPEQRPWKNEMLVTYRNTNIIQNASMLSIQTENEAIDLVTAYAHIMINKTIGNDTNQQNACQ